ncbi:MAG: ATP-binding protein [Candidatus Omnitrophota bacterium]|jgi:signal transduction histidine kinase
MLSYEYLISILGVAFLIIIISLVAFVLSKMEKIKGLSSIIESLNKSLDEMDEQAKLIVRTDIELNKTQEELDKKIAGLYTLQKLSRAISTTLEGSQIFKMVEANYLESLGFEKTCGFLWDSQKNEFLLQMSIGYSEEEMSAIKAAISKDRDFFLNFIRNEKTTSSMSLTDIALKNKIEKTLRSTAFVIAPILPKEGEKGFFAVATENTDTSITDGDEELITILANEIGQALENARLFEKTWHTQQQLEQKVEERTRELTNALNAVKTIDKRKSDFVSSVSHELRTPLTSIKGYAAILLTGKLGTLPPQAKERLEKINRHSDELGHIVNNLLDISRIESGKMVMNLGKHSLKEIIGKTDDLLSGQLKENKITFSINIDPDISVLVDPEQIGRVLINLIGNAMKFTPAGGKININARRLNDGTAQVDISDTGCGIATEDLEAIFEEFYRVENTINQKVRGTGLGLALVKRIIKAHQGKIWVKSAVGSGSTFSFTIQQG